MCIYVCVCALNSIVHAKDDHIEVAVIWSNDPWNMIIYIYMIYCYKATHSVKISSIKKC